MDAKARKKILNCLKKDGGEQDVFDIAVAVKIDEDAVQAELEEMSKDGLAVSRLNEKGVAQWKLADDAPAAKPAKKPADEVDIADFEPKPAAPAPAGNAVDDMFDPGSAVKPAKPVPPPAPPPPAPPPIQAPRPPAPPKAPPPPVPVQATAPTAQFDIDDFEPKPKKEKPVKEKKVPDLDDFEPKQKKEKVVREKPDNTVGNDLGGDESDRPSAKLPMPVLAGAAAAIFVVIILIIVAASGGGKAKAAVETARAEFTKELEAYKEEANGKIAKLEEDQKALQAKVDAVEAKLKERREREPNTPPKGGNKPVRKR